MLGITERGTWCGWLFPGWLMNPRLTLHGRSMLVQFVGTMGASTLDFLGDNDDAVDSLEWNFRISSWFFSISVLTLAETLIFLEVWRLMYSCLTRFL